MTILKHWRAFTAIFRLKASPVLEFEYYLRRTLSTPATSPTARNTRCN